MPNHIIKTLFIFLSFFLFCCSKGPVYQGEKAKPCDIHAKPSSFCILEAYGSVTLCSKCHPGDGPFDILSYKEVHARVVPGSPESSVLYRYLTKGGKMHAFGTDHFEKAAYRWIQDGALP
ncbi:LIC11213 family lipoprotein [Leptospira haakeii]|uniref:Uncharacterized protein n=1 Tax=Leptospira haakeii TaxID=2023198 RepID=A0ABX4PKY5_9LEPT|nr:hypothetical protein [Leptospira haakeii]PKA15698.1 hypothetical protein CH363_11835 [Leptospira haakeii]PKA21784.1 hypothetical protein CH377_05435 [Leptospira haakeii]